VQRPATTARTRRGRLARALLVTAALAFAAEAAERDDLEGPRAALAHFIAVFNTLDWEAFRACFADDASVFNPQIPEVVSLHRLDGRESIERTFRAVFAAGSKGQAPRGPHIVPQNVRIQRFDDTAIVTFEFDRAGQSVGRRTVVLHQQGGAWLIVHIHASNVDSRP
jgi:ketosteroid isomerase-like protein